MESYRFTLPFQERLLLVNRVLPTECGMSEQIQVHNIKSVVDLTDEEKKMIDLDEHTGQADPEKTRLIDPEEFELTEKECDFIGDSFVRLAQEERLLSTDTFFSLEMKFLPWINIDELKLDDEDTEAFLRDKKESIVSEPISQNDRVSREAESAD